MGIQIHREDSTETYLYYNSDINSDTFTLAKIKLCLLGGGVVRWLTLVDIVFNGKLLLTTVQQALNFKGIT